MTTIRKQIESSLGIQTRQPDLEAEYEYCRQIIATFDKRLGYSPRRAVEKVMRAALIQRLIEIEKTGAVVRRYWGYDSTEEANLAALGVRDPGSERFDL